MTSATQHEEVINQYKKYFARAILSIVPSTLIPTRILGVIPQSHSDQTDLPCLECAVLEWLPAQPVLSQVHIGQTRPKTSGRVGTMYSTG